MELLLSALVTSLSLPVGVALLKSQDQTEADRQRLGFTLGFPPDLRPGDIEAWLSAVVGALNLRRGLLSGMPTIAFELRADAYGIIHRVRLPKAQANYLVSQLRTQIPGTRVMPEDRPPKDNWTDAIELGHRRPSQTLRAIKPEVVAASLLASVQGLGKKEAVLIQLVATGAVPEQVPTARPTRRSSLFGDVREHESEETKDRREKQKHPNFLAVVRLAVRASSADRGKALLRQARSAFASLDTAGNGFKKVVTVSKSGLLVRVEQAAGKLVYHAQLSLPELASLTGWPIGHPHVAGLSPSRARQLPPSASVPSKGLVIGHSNFPGAERDIAVSHTDACKHIQILSPTGGGKTTLMANLAAQLIRQGYGVIVLETKGDLYRQVADLVPPARLDDVIAWDFADTERPLGFNVLTQSGSRRGVDELNLQLAAMYPDSGVITPQVMYFGLHALAATPGGTFIDLPVMLSPRTPEEEAWRQQLVADIKNPEYKRFWQRYLAADPKTQDRESAPLHRRLWPFTARPEVRNSLGQSTSSFQMDDVVRQGKVLLVNLAGVQVGQSTAAICGSLILNAIWTSVRANKLKRPVFLFLDEFQELIKLRSDPNEMLAQARSFQLSMILAHQHASQLPREVEQAVMNNARTKLIFQTTADDARIMARHFGRMVSEDDFLGLGPHEAIAKVAVGTTVSPPLTLTALPPAKPTGSYDEVVRRSRERYGRPVAEVEAEIQARRSAPQKTTKAKPKVGPQQWGGA
ncbi:type IV secretory system conjugative DNA transfer family protein [Actinokineospora guangxiensis]|uniref:Type IV secretory system conjugative DNA transfer family protein n=1 Tax=Actinokineospora guangxiensis TaxID=1490288 RepID=A0ABW0EUE5_9PSEU